MSDMIITGQDLERWRYDHGFVVGTAAECFGIQRSKWEALVRSDEVITDLRLINLYKMYTEYPATIPALPSFDYIGLFNELGLANDTRSKKEFARLLGVSVTAVYRILDNNAAGRDIDAYAYALRKTGLKGKDLLSFMKSMRKKSEASYQAGKDYLKEQEKQS